MKRKFVLALAAAASMMSLGTIAHATPAVVAIDVAPPTPIVEAVPAPREGFTWSPGYYAWTNGGYTWVNGSWIENRVGLTWVAPHWQQGPDGRWMLAGGAWLPRDQAVAVRMGRDRDRDGVPDAIDDDKDNDGLPNRYDRHPNNPWRR
ncbi:MAG TPA: hypothetical protein VHA82_02360 [Ramlibacter sp.]|uniref:hypothetical protein n=1 Tax=Ramlibacter sp. TaxID=1917967 RepID=UPI002BAD109F|nr:hypothetical protein [Ramlibacter sp.]HVZ42625.1 hypothetical protein [Ramlibacter sp.]